MTAPKVWEYPGIDKCGRPYMEQALAFAYSAGKNNQSVRYRRADFTREEMYGLMHAWSTGQANIDEPTARFIMARGARRRTDGP